jgi:MoaA/NifB/PqqE/SkfB family radical SAM enzyme
MFSNFDGRKMLANVERWRPLADGVIPDPVANSLDLSSADKCPNACYFCNVKKTQLDGGHMTDETFRQVVDVYQRHDVKSCCIAGGGESLANPRSSDYIHEILAAGTGVGVITNGRFYRQMPHGCSFVNVSVNAADGKTYEKMCGVSARRFDDVCENIKRWVAEDQTVTYKVMITNENKSPGILVDSVKKADSLGVCHVLFRFAMLPWNLVNHCNEYVTLTDEEADLYEAHIAVLRKHYPHIEISMPLERYDRSSRKFVPKRCTGGMVNFVTLWNGDVVLCSDHRTNPAMKLCHISEFSRWWGSEKHKELLAAVDVEKCPRCSFFLHDKIVDEFVFNDASNQFFI